MREDDAKVAEREAELAEETRELIADLGEAGWRSPFYTGPAPDLRWDTYSARYRHYRQWRTARDLWTQTGDKAYLIELDRHVTWTVPPDPGELPEVKPAGQVPSSPPVQLSRITVGFIIAIIILGIVLETLVIWLASLCGSSEYRYSAVYEETYRSSSGYRGRRWHGSGSRRHTGACLQSRSCPGPAG